MNLTLPLEAAVYSVIDSRVASVSEYAGHILDVLSVHKTLPQTADSMAKQTNCKHRDVEVCVGDFVWFQTKYLRQPASLSHKLAPRFFGPFRILKAVTPISFCLDLPSGWRIYLVFHISQLKAAVFACADLPSNQVYLPPSDEFGEFKVKDVLDVQVSRSSLCEFHVLWKYCSLFEIMQEPESHVENAPDILSNFCRHRSLPLRAMASSEGE